MQIETKIIEKLNPKRWQEYKQLKLESLTEEPLAFSPGLKEYETYDDKRWQVELKKLSEYPHTLIFVEADGELIGLGGIYYYQQESFKHNIFLQSLYVKPNWRGKRIGTKIIQFEIDIATRNPIIKNILCEIFSSQGESIKLHQKFGFELVGTIKNFICQNGKCYDKCNFQKILHN